jgi:peptidoglycan/LPS O-acetylase OafA/YrhL
LLAGLLEDREQVARHARRFALLFLTLAAVTLSYPLWGRIVLRRVLQAPALTILSLNLFFMTLFYFCVVGTAVCFGGRPWLAPLRDRRLAYLGRISYGLYLYHPLVYIAVDSAADHFGLGRSFGLDLLKFTITVGVAACSWRFIEQPILALKDRFDYRPGPTPMLAPEGSQLLPPDVALIPSQDILKQGVDQLRSGDGFAESHHVPLTD